MYPPRLIERYYRILSSVFRKKVKELGSEYYETKDIPFKVIKQDINGTEFSINNNTFMLTMLGNHQIENAICAIKTLYVLREEGKIKISDEEIYEIFTLSAI